ncbi:MAG: tRNA (uridine(34)/cytosine(34)/5-carboxymethylaminomethyluridine(34)-2'-O)-methyltransferase TrmL [Gammaproteobacteria bacterium]|nr:tRNA (uridine(34)/cytosine(34)/5-carboxymethylaminomethyluridine(34)-2'-O)-methyltransferase TrmL [Gammaproteobacteria bacterium]
MFHIVLFEPEIPPNTGNIIRLCANTGSQLHLIEPLGFDLDDRKLRRAGLDYGEWASLQTHPNIGHFLEKCAPTRLLGFSTRGQTAYSACHYQAGDAFIFGPETRGLPNDVLNSLEPAHRLRLPMVASSRSLNLSNTVAVVIYEAWRQMGFEGGA